MVKPSAYLALGEELSFMDVALRVRMNRVTLVGYFDLDPDSPDSTMIPYINPPDKDELRVRAYIRARCTVVPASASLIQ